MTVANIFKQPDAIHFVTDGAAIDSRGRLDHLAHKIEIMPHIKAVVCVRGTAAARALFCSEITKAESYDALKIDMPVRIRAADDLAGPALRNVDPNILTAEIFVAGWSDQNGPDAFAMATTDFNAKFLPAWKVVPLEGCTLPGDEALQREFMWLHDKFDEQGAVELVRRQREVKAPLPKNPSKNSSAGVGGFVQLTTVRKDSISTRILKRWPDRIGEKIQPIAA